MGVAPKSSIDFHGENPPLARSLSGAIFGRNVLSAANEGTSGLPGGWASSKYNRLW